MDKKKILDDFKKKKKLKALFRLDDSAEVVGTEVDEDNHLHYIIRDGAEFQMERAEKFGPATFVPPSNPKTVLVRSGKIVKVT